MNKDALVFAEAGLVFARAISQDTPTVDEREVCEDQLLVQEQLLQPA